MQKQKHDTLCWGCDKACGKCSWSREFVPVPGWKAIPTKIFQWTSKGEHRRKCYTNSFDVYECPEFEPLKVVDTLRFLKEVDVEKVKKKGEPEKRRKRERLESAIETMIEMGMSYSQIAAETGVSRTTVYRINKKGKSKND